MHEIAFTYGIGPMSAGPSTSSKTMVLPLAAVAMVKVKFKVKVVFTDSVYCKVSVVWYGVMQIELPKKTS